VLEIAAAILVWKIAGGDEVNGVFYWFYWITLLMVRFAFVYRQLQAVLSRDIEKHIDNINNNWESRRFLDIMQLKVR
jgi:hypothetical protein